MKTVDKAAARKALHYAVSVQRVPRHKRHASGKSWKVQSASVGGCSSFLWQLSKRPVSGAN